MTTVPATSFRPRRRFRLPVAAILVWTAVTVGLAIAALGVLVLAQRAPLGLPPSRGMDLLAAGFLVAVGPGALRAWLAQRRRWALEERLPDFLADLAALHKAGLTLPDALQTAATGDYGALTKEVRITADQVRWNLPVLTALTNLRTRVATPICDRTLTVVIEAGRTGGNLPEVMDVAASNARAFVNLRQARVRQMGLYTIIIYLASAVFIGVALALQLIFVPKMLTGFAGAGAGLGFGGNIPSADAFRGLFFAAALVQAVGNGLVGGVMADGSARAGLRHAWSLVALTVLGFAWS